MESATSVEIVWRKSSLSGMSNECVEVGVLVDGRVAVRDSKDPEGPFLILSPGTWSNFLKHLQSA
ncbi:DUF397 domain-containing protein [Planomonospora sp. ID67723]|uniref:DUF397 domain-containing protein n=1 Tax=Planomonospora sp. ID67723 TaxID=2738134 RepID=UPI0018C435FE|nr:DUF397 domain-containing protein [Planomonospora sp. ID67723]MBG0827361.1 DUF397 domain-containing protein [Planomonospora sp. ID67723]